MPFLSLLYFTIAFMPRRGRRGKAEETTDTHRLGSLLGGGLPSAAGFFFVALKFIFSLAVTKIRRFRF